MRKLVYYVAVTADGFIAGEDGSFGMFPTEGPHMPDMLADYPDALPTHVRDMLKLEGSNKNFDAVLMGRATYEVGAKEGITSPYQHLEQYVFSTSLGASPHPSVKVIDSNPIELVKSLKRSAGRDIWLCGGGKLAAALAPEIDTVVLKHNPVLIGKGIPLFAKAITPLRLKLTDKRIYENGYMRLHYEKL
jgi:dihydrofolate reductase